MRENGKAKIVFNACCVIHTVLGPGLLELAYEAVLAGEAYRWRGRCPWALNQRHRQRRYQS